MIALIGGKCFAQISPGELSGVHSHLEGISNCTKCHTLGEQLSNQKCLDCHKELSERIRQNKGYHASSEVKGKQCASCHSDHHGKNFQIVKFDEKKFNHHLTGFYLKGAHIKKECKDCHQHKFIQDQNIKAKKFTYLGLKSDCLNCHADYHKNTLSKSCAICHDELAFKPVTKFNHGNTRFPLKGKHINVECNKCHKVETKNGEKYQQFTGLVFNTCVSCHTDVHKNKFGQNCTQCHTVESFAVTKGMKSFDHDKTRYKLEGKHQVVNCKLCHKIKFTTPLKHDKCADCHLDYHKGQFVKGGIVPDCKLCHHQSGFANSTYTLEQHNTSVFPLKGAHLAVSCLDCHKKTDRWNFKNIGNKCIDCHKDIHATIIPQKYYPENNCLSCHSNNRWNEITFDHSKTNFILSGVHKTQTCRKCHFTVKPDGSPQQLFVNFSGICTNCHVDPHFKQFEQKGVTECKQCHAFDNWKAVNFDHNTTAFKLVGKHEKVECKKCHLPTATAINNNKYVLYKISVKCESCHL